MKNINTDEQEDTEEEGLEGFIVDAAIAAGPSAHGKALRRFRDRIHTRRRVSIKMADGKWRSYGEYRDEDRAKTIAALIFAVVLIGLFILGTLSAHKGPFLVIANVLVASGTFIVAKGAILKRDAAAWLNTILAQEAGRETKFIREPVLIRKLISILDIVIDPAQAESAIEHLQKELAQKESKGEKIYVIKQSDIAQMFLDVSATSEIGTPLIVLGTLMITLFS